MTPNMENYLRRHNIKWTDIKYIIRENGKTCIYLDSGRCEETYNTIKSIIAVLPKDEFVSANKGVVLAKRKIISINGQKYLMNDSREFVGRAHQTGGHAASVTNLNALPLTSGNILSELMCGKYNALNDMPLPFCIIELVFNEEGKGVDFLFRYCNKGMEKLSDRKVEDIVNQSFYEIFVNADKKWLVPYIEVAMNGTPRVIEKRGADGTVDHTMYCFQVAQNFCACLIVVS